MIITPTGNKLTMYNSVIMISSLVFLFAWIVACTGFMSFPVEKRLFAMILWRFMSVLRMMRESRIMEISMMRHGVSIPQTDVYQKITLCQ